MEVFNMASCTNFSSCPMRLSATSPNITTYIIGYFCNDRFTKCAVYSAGIVAVAETPDQEVCLPDEASHAAFSGNM
jgi:hypothetical protein